MKCAWMILLVLVGQHDIEVVSATGQELVPGVRAARRIVNYRIVIRVQRQQEIVFDSMWVQGERLKIKNGEQDSSDNTIELIATGHTPGRKNFIAPREYKGAALIRYTVNTSVRFLEIPIITLLPKIYAP